MNIKKKGFKKTKLRDLRTSQAIEVDKASESPKLKICTRRLCSCEIFLWNPISQGYGPELEPWGARDNLGLS